jgi:hypothetical protein
MTLSGENAEARVHTLLVPLTPALPPPEVVSAAAEAMDEDRQLEIVLYS